MYPFCHVWKGVAITTMIALLQAFPTSLFAQGTSTLQQFEGTIQLSTNGVVPFQMQGDSAALGRLTCYGEMVFTPGVQPGSLIGQGVTVFQNSQGETLVGVTNWNVSAPVNNYCTVTMQFTWRDSIRLSNGSVVANTGRFRLERPADMNAQGIIAILIGLIQKR